MRAKTPGQDNHFLINKDTFQGALANSKNADTKNIADEMQRQLRGRTFTSRMCRPRSDPQQCKTKTERTQQFNGLDSKVAGPSRRGSEEQGSCPLSSGVPSSARRLLWTRPLRWEERELPCSNCRFRVLGPLGRFPSEGPPDSLLEGLGTVGAAAGPRAPS